MLINKNLSYSFLKFLNNFFIGQKSTSITGLTICVNSVSKKGFYFQLARFINKNLYRIKFLGIGAIVNRYNNNFSLYSSSEDNNLYKDYNLKDSLFINIGSGGFHHKYWKNFDYPAQTAYYKKIQGTKHLDYIPTNLCCEDKLKLSTDSVDLIYMSHTLEHIEYKYIEKLFKVISVALKEKGTFRIAIPDTEEEFLRAKITYNSESISNNIKTQLIRNVAKRMYSRSVNISEDKLLEIIINCDFNPKKFANIIKNDYPNFTKFDPLSPENHITFLNYDELISLSKRYDLKAFRKTCFGESTAKPFTNRYVFDITETQMSCYFDIGKSI